MPAAPRPSQPLTVADGVIIVIGIVVGAGIFKTPSIVAAHAGSEGWLLLAWVAGGAISLAGALCYAELATAFPGRGGEYHYMRRAFGAGAGFLFAWSRMTVIQTGSIAMLAFLVGDYAAPLLGGASAAQVAALIVVLLTLLNLAGLSQGKRMQWLLVGALGLGFLFILTIGATLLPAPRGDPPAAAGFLPGKAMIFVLLTFGGWNEAAYLSAEVREAQRNMVRVLVISILLITLLYLAINLVLLRALGVSGMSASEAVAADLMRLALGERGAFFISALVILASLSTLNATIITGARSIFALGRDLAPRSVPTRAPEQHPPTGALLLQGAIALVLVMLGAGARNGFEAMVEYTAPVFWFFFLLVGLSLFVLRRREPGAPRPFRVPLYPGLPLLFCAVCAAMLFSSLAFTGFGALVGAGVLLSGIPVLYLARLGGAAKPNEEEKR